MKNNVRPDLAGLVVQLGPCYTERPVEVRTADEQVTSAHERLAVPLHIIGRETSVWPEYGSRKRAAFWSCDSAYRSGSSR